MVNKSLSISTTSKLILDGTVDSSSSERISSRKPGIKSSRYCRAFSACSSAASTMAVGLYGPSCDQKFFLLALFSSSSSSPTPDVMVVRKDLSSSEDVDLVVVPAMLMASSAAVSPLVLLKAKSISLREWSSSTNRRACDAVSKAVLTRLQATADGCVSLSKAWLSRRLACVAFFLATSKLASLVLYVCPAPGRTTTSSTGLLWCWSCSFLLRAL